MGNEIKIIAAVKFNDHLAFVLNRDLDFKYEKAGDYIIGTDEGFVNSYVKESYTDRFKAFGGRKFEIKLIDGSIIKCHGQWWSGGEFFAEKYLNLNLEPFTYNTIDNLKKCYVYHGCSIDSAYKNRLIHDYMNPENGYYGLVYEYRDYEKLITYDSKIDNYIKELLYSKKRIKSLISEVKKKHSIILKLKSNE